MSTNNIQLQKDLIDIGVDRILTVDNRLNFPWVDELNLRSHQDEWKYLKTQDKRKKLEVLRLNSKPDQVASSIILQGGHCGECSLWTEAMIKIMPKNLYRATFGDNSVSRVSVFGEVDGQRLDHCYNVSSSSNNPGDWLTNTDYQLLDVWLGETYQNKMTERLHDYNGKGITNPFLCNVETMNENNCISPSQYLSQISDCMRREAGIALAEDLTKLKLKCCERDPNFASEWEKENETIGSNFSNKMKDGNYIDVNVFDFTEHKRWLSQYGSPTQRDNMFMLENAMENRDNIIAATIKKILSGEANEEDKQLLDYHADLIGKGGQYRDDVGEWLVCYRTLQALDKCNDNRAVEQIVKEFGMRCLLLNSTNLGEVGQKRMKTMLKTLYVAACNKMDRVCLVPELGRDNLNSICVEIAQTLQAEFEHHQTYNKKPIESKNKSVKLNEPSDDEAKLINFSDDGSKLNDSKLVDLESDSESNDSSHEDKKKSNHKKKR